MKLRKAIKASDKRRYMNMLYKLQDFVAQLGSNVNGHLEADEMSEDVKIDMISIKDTLEDHFQEITYLIEKVKNDIK